MNPQEPINIKRPESDGITFRAYVATQIISGIAANFHIAQSKYNSETVAKIAVTYADALIKELNQQNT